MNDEKIRKDYQPTDAVYIPAKHYKHTIDCFFTNSIHKTRRTTLSPGKSGAVEHTNAYECYSYSQFFAIKERLEAHLKICSKMSGVIYKFEHQSPVTYEDNSKFIGDLLFAACFDFEATVGSNTKIFSYLNKEMLENLDQVTAKQRKDCAVSAFNKTTKFAFSEIFSTELKVASDCIKNWFRQRFNIPFLELYAFKKQKYEKEKLIDWSLDKCVIYQFALLLGTVNGVESKELTYYDFIIRREHMLLRNIYNLEVLRKSPSLGTLEGYYDSFMFFVRVFILLYEFYIKNSNIEFIITFLLRDL